MVTDPRQKSPSQVYREKIAEGMSPTDAKRYVESLREQVRAGQAAPPVIPEGPSRFGSGFARSLAQGASLGFSDEVVGALRGALSPNQTWREGIQSERDALSEYKDAHQGTAMLAEIGGGLVTGGGALGALRAARLAPKAIQGLATIPRAAMEGASVGAAAGVGTAEGGVMDRAKGGAIGAALGGFLGGTAHGVARTASHAADVLNLRPKSVSPMPAPTGGGQLYSNPVDPEAMADAARTAAGGARNVYARAVETVDDRSNEMILRKLQEGKRSLDDIRAEHDPTLPETLVELGGQPMERAARGAHAVPGEGSAMIEEGFGRRLRGTFGRMKGHLQEFLGADDVGGYTQLKGQVEGRASRAAREYPEALAEEVDDQSLILDFFGDEDFADAYRIAERIARKEGRALPSLDDLMSGQATLPVSALQTMKAGLDDAIESGFGGKRKVGRREAAALRKQYNDWLSRVYEAAPKYAEVQGKYADASRLIRAFRQGSGRKLKRTDEAVRTFRQMDDDELTNVLGEMTPDEQDMFKMGVYDALKQEMMGKGLNTNLARVIWGKHGSAPKFRALFGDEGTFTRFGDRMDRELRIGETPYKVLGNSQTARVEADKDDLAAEAAKGFAEGATTGNPLYAIGSRLANHWFAQRLQGRTKALSDALAPKLIAGVDDPQDLLKVLDMLEEYQKRTAGRRATMGAARTGTAAGGTVGTMNFAREIL